MDKLSKKLELPVMAAVAQLPGKAYGISVMDEVSARKGSEVGYGAIHTTLSRLETKGLLRSQMGEATPERGGRRKRMYQLTGYGETALASAMSALATN